MEKQPTVCHSHVYVHIVLTHTHNTILWVYANDRNISLPNGAHHMVHISVISSIFHATLCSSLFPLSIYLSILLFCCSILAHVFRLISPTSHSHVIANAKKHQNIKMFYLHITALSSFEMFRLKQSVLHRRALLNHVLLCILYALPSSTLVCVCVLSTAVQMTAKDVSATRQ